MAELETDLVPLRNWVKNEAKKITTTNTEPNKKLIVICQTTVAYGIAELLLLRDLVQTQKKKKSKETLRLAIAAARELASMSEHNFLNKKELLEAELYSFEKKNDSALASYDASIASARNSRFTHEQGLACERAGFHCKKVNDKGRALQYFQQARECYEEWGSSVKVDFIKKEMDNFTCSAR